METKGQRIWRFLITGALDEAIWGWFIRGAVVSGFTSIWGMLENLSPVAIFVYSLWALVGIVSLLSFAKWSFRVMPNKAINVEFFEVRSPLSWYRQKIQSARSVWAAYLGGGSVD